MTLTTPEGQGKRGDSEISISQERGQAGGAGVVHPAVGCGPGLSLAGVSRDASGHFHCRALEFHSES